MPQQLIRLQVNLQLRLLHQLRRQQLTLLFNGVAGVIGPNGLRLAMIPQQIRSIKIQINIIQNVAELVTVFKLMSMVKIPLLQWMTPVAIALMRVNLKKRRMQIMQRDVFNSFPLLRMLGRIIVNLNKIPYISKQKNMISTQYP